MVSSDGRKLHNSDRNSNVTQQLQHPRFRKYKWWLRVSLYIIFLLVGQSAATLLGRLYYDNGGNSKWMATFVQSAGFPVLLPLLFYFPRQTHAKFNNNPSNNDYSYKTKPKFSTLVFLYLAFGLILTGDNLMYSYGLLYLPLSTYSLLCATQLGFNAVFSFFLNSPNQPQGLPAYHTPNAQTPPIAQTKKEFCSKKPVGFTPNSGVIC